MGGLLLALSATISPAFALNLDLPGEAFLTREEDQDADTYFLPTGPVVDGSVPVRELEGRVVRQAWRIEGEALSTLTLVNSVRSQLQDAGYELLLDCTTEECGGFDFRFGTDVLPGPDMFVDLFDFHFLSAHNASADGAEYMTALISRAGQAGYVQLVLVGASGAPVVVGSAPLTVPGDDPEARDSVGLSDELIHQGHVILRDLVFETGSSTLAEGPYASLSELAEFLTSDPERRVALVGHTDAVGSLEDNVGLSRQRAASVMERLISDHGVAEDQVSSNGMGYLAPVASNATPEGRTANRRVEAVLLNSK